MCLALASDTWAEVMFVTSRKKLRRTRMWVHSLAIDSGRSTKTVAEPFSLVFRIKTTEMVSPLTYHGRVEQFCECIKNELLCFKWVNWMAWELYLSQSVQFSCSVVSNSLRHHGLQHAGLPVHHQLPEFTQTHVHWVSDAILLPHPLSSPSPPNFNLSQHQGFFH